MKRFGGKDRGPYPQIFLGRPAGNLEKREVYCLCCVNLFDVCCFLSKIVSNPSMIRRAGNPLWSCAESASEEAPACLRLGMRDSSCYRQAHVAHRVRFQTCGSRSSEPVDAGLFRIPGLCRSGASRRKCHLCSRPFPEFLNFFDKLSNVYHHGTRVPVVVCFQAAGRVIQCLRHIGPQPG